MRPRRWRSRWRWMGDDDVDARCGAGGDRGGADEWWLELLGAPEEHSPRDKAFHRVQIGHEHFAICSFS